MNKIKILAIVGSFRKDSYNKQLALLAKEMIGDKADFELLDYKDIPFMNEDIEFPAPESVKRVRDAVKNADGIWFFTPEYNHTYPGSLKNIIDWLSRPISETEPQVLAGKPAAISGIGLGIAGTSIAQDFLVALISYLNMNVMNVPRVTIPSGWQLLNSEGKLEFNEMSKQDLERQVNAFLSFIKA